MSKPTPTMPLARARRLVRATLREYLDARTQPERDRSHARLVLHRHAFVVTYGAGAWRPLVIAELARRGLSPVEHDRLTLAES